MRSDIHTLANVEQLGTRVESALTIHRLLAWLVGNSAAKLVLMLLFGRRGDGIERIPRYNVTTIPLFRVHTIKVICYFLLLLSSTFCASRNRRVG